MRVHLLNTMSRSTFYGPFSRRSRCNLRKQPRVNPRPPPFADHFRSVRCHLHSDSESGFRIRGRSRSDPYASVLMGVPTVRDSCWWKCAVLIGVDTSRRADMERGSCGAPEGSPPPTRMATLSLLQPSNEAARDATDDSPRSATVTSSPALKLSEGNPARSVAQARWLEASRVRRPM